ncbi:MAG: YraN family protein [Candidatus Promineifilaceae bacterium]
MPVDEPSLTGSDPRRRLGRWGENLAADHLTAKGYRILSRNWRTRYGEIDLVAEKQERIAFIEVKTRRGNQFGLPEEAITPQKGRRLLKLGQAYISEHGLHDTSWQIDLVAIELDDEGSLIRCEHIPNAVMEW